MITAAREKASLTNICLLSLLVVNFSCADYAKRFGLDMAKVPSQPWRLYTAFFLVGNEVTRNNLSSALLFLFAIKQLEGSSRGRSFANIVWQFALRLLLVVVLNLPLNSSSLYSSLSRSLFYQILVLNMDKEIKIPYVGSLRIVFMALTVFDLINDYVFGAGAPGALQSLAGILAAHLPLLVTMDSSPVPSSLKRCFEIAPSCVVDRFM